MWSTQVNKRREMKRFIEDLKKEFYRLLQQKTGWGKDEVYTLFIEAIGNVLIKELTGYSDNCFQYNQRVSEDNIPLDQRISK